MPDNLQIAKESRVGLTDLLADRPVAADHWFPWWKKPVLMSDWEKLLSQYLRTAVATTEAHRSAKECGMPFWFVRKTAHTKWKACRRYWRLRRRIELAKRDAAVKLLHVLGPN